MYIMFLFYFADSIHVVSSFHNKVVLNKMEENMKSKKKLISEYSR